MSCFDEQEWEALQDEVWEHGDLWGPDKYAVRNWLQKVWEEEEATRRAEYDKSSLSATKNAILDWWWPKYQDEQGERTPRRGFTKRYAMWLKGQFDITMRREKQRLKVNPKDNRVLPPRRIPRRFM